MYGVKLYCFNELLKGCHYVNNPGGLCREAFQLPLQIIRNDITRVKADIIVNSANPQPLIGGGTDLAVYTAAGAENLLKIRKKIGVIAPGNAAVTPAFRLPAKYIIHTVGPVWVDGCHGELDTLRSCYSASLSMAVDLKAKSIAFPLIATGVYGFPKAEALQIALSETGRFLRAHDMSVILVVFDRDSFELSEKLSGEIEAFIDDHEAAFVHEAEYAPFSERQLMLRRQSAMQQTAKNRRRSDAAPSFPSSAVPKTQAPPDEERDFCVSAGMEAVFTPAEHNGLEDMLRQPGETFQQKLLRLIDASGMTDVDVYKKANIDRRVFSRIRSRKDYKPKKVTAVAFSIALELDWDTMSDLLSRAGIAFSPSDRFDLIIRYFVTHRNYDIFEINAALFKYGQPILGEG